tara:strand:+ start:208 stop:630 length:423 start_codon:yes stop_codon:yes gene_type:complete
MATNNLYDALGFTKQTKTRTTNGKLSLEGEIKREIRSVIHEMLLTKYPHLYVNLDTTTIIKQDGEGNLSDMNDVSGYRLLIPMDEKVEVKNGNNKVVLANAVKVSDPQIYLQGIQNNVCEFVKIGGKTHTWNNKESKFTK